MTNYYSTFSDIVQRTMNQISVNLEGLMESWWPYVISFVITLISAIRFYVGGLYCKTSARVDDKNIIITGASSGIGLETAKELIKRGGNLILAVRNGEKGIKALEQIRKIKRDANVQIKLLDVSEFGSIKNFVEQINQEYRKIDVLINNAGIINDNSTSLDISEAIFLTNYLGPYLLTHLLLPLLSRSENGRVINVSALAHYNGKLNLDEVIASCSNQQEAFADSKLALTAFTKYMAQLYKGTYITFNSVSPGLVRNTGHFANFSALNGCYLTRLAISPWVWLFMKTPKQGCQSIVYLAVEPSLNTVTGCFFSDCQVKEPAEIVNNMDVTRALYEKTYNILSVELENMHIPNEFGLEAAVN